jgi:hypothetical protein
MAAFVLFVVAVAGAVVVAADLVWENTAAGQVTVFHQTVIGYPEGWLLAIAAGLGFVVALLLVTSVNSTKGRRARRKQLVRLRPGLEDHMVAPEPDHARLLDAFFGPEVPSRHLGGPARPVDLLGGERPESRTGDDQRWLILEPIQYPTEPLYQQTRSANVREKAGRAERKMIRAASQATGSSIPPSRSTSRPGGPLACTRTGISRSRPARGAGGSGARGGSRRQGAVTTRWPHAGAIGPIAPG